MVSVLKTFTKILCVNECDFMQVVDFLKGIIPYSPVSQIKTLRNAARSLHNYYWL